MIKYLKILLFQLLVFVGCEDEVEELPYIELEWISWGTSDNVGKYVYGLDFDTYEATGIGVLVFLEVVILFITIKMKKLFQMCIYPCRWWNQHRYDYSRFI